MASFSTLYEDELPFDVEMLKHSNISNKIKSFINKPTYLRVNSAI